MTDRADSSEEPRPGPDSATPGPAIEPPPDLDQARRHFFGDFAREIARTAATAFGTASALQRSTTAAAQVLLGTAEPLAQTSPPSAPPSDALPYAGLAVRAVDGAAAGFRTPFRFAPDDDDVLLVVDQRRLPEVLVEVEVRSAGDAAFAIREMIVRGAPAIGQVAAIGIALTAAEHAEASSFARRAIIKGAGTALLNARPTAVNVRWAVRRILDRYAAIGDLDATPEAVRSELRREADRIVEETTADHGRLAEAGLALLPATGERPVRVLTHCNTGPLACGQYGTALGVVQAAHHAERPIHVFVDETRPWLQGARLTAWELVQAGVSHEVIADAAAGSLMASGEVDVVLVGADRVAANGDTANKIGTYGLAVLARHHGVPFYVCAPLSSVDLEAPDGTAIPIEERSPDEVLGFRGVRVAPAGSSARNPAFDVTPAALITGIVTDEGVLAAPYEPAIRSALDRRAARWADRAIVAPPTGDAVAPPAADVVAPPTADVVGTAAGSDRSAGPTAGAA